jgi:hypothetical protein
MLGGAVLVGGGGVTAVVAAEVACPEPLEFVAVSSTLIV